MKAYGRMEKTQAEKEEEKQKEREYQAALLERKRLSMQVTDGMVAGRKLRMDMQIEIDHKATADKMVVSTGHLPIIGERKLPKMKDLRPTSDELLKMTIK